MFWKMIIFIHYFSTKVTCGLLASETIEKWTELNSCQAGKNDSIFHIFRLRCQGTVVKRPGSKLISSEVVELRRLNWTTSV